MHNERAKQAVCDGEYARRSTPPSRRCSSQLTKRTTMRQAHLLCRVVHPQPPSGMAGCKDTPEARAGRLEFDSYLRTSNLTSTHGFLSRRGLQAHALRCAKFGPETCRTSCRCSALAHTSCVGWRYGAGQFPKEMRRSPLSGLHACTTFLARISSANVSLIRFDDDIFLTHSSCLGAGCLRQTYRRSGRHVRRKEIRCEMYGNRLRRPQAR
jgi:hypothetical protein